MLMPFCRRRILTVSICCVALVRASVLAQDASDELTVLGEAVVVDVQSRRAIFTIAFSAPPDFLTVDENGRQRDEFQYLIDANAAARFGEFEFANWSEAVIRGGEVHVGGDIRVRDPRAEDPGDPTSGGWGPLVGSVPYLLDGSVLTFAVPLHLLKEWDGQLTYLLQTVRYGAQSFITARRSDAWAHIDGTAVLEYLDRSAKNGTLQGVGPGASGTRRLQALRQQLDSARSLMDAGLLVQSCDQYLDAYSRIRVGQTTARDFAQGSAVPTLAAMILHVVTNIGCIASPLPIGGPPEPPDPGSPTDTLQWRLSVELLTDKVDRCPPDECFLTAGRVDLQPEPIQLPLVTFDCWVDGRDHGNCTSVAYPDGTTVTLTATPLGSSRFDGWGGACSGAQNSCTVSMNEDKKVVAHFSDGL